MRSIRQVMHVAAGCLFVNAEDDVLLVKPTYKEPWEIPGGAVEIGESPLTGCVREIREELGIDCEPERLLSVDYRPSPSDDQLDRIRFTFFGGVLSNDDTARFVLNPSELTEWRFVDTVVLDDYVIPPLARRIRTSLGSPVALYLESGERRL